jgi:hypothetical protein
MVSELKEFCHLELELWLHCPPSYRTVTRTDPFTVSQQTNNQTANIHESNLVSYFSQGHLDVDVLKFQISLPILGFQGDYWLMVILLLGLFTVYIWAVLTMVEVGRGSFHVGIVYGHT